MLEWIVVAAALLMMGAVTAAALGAAGTHSADPPPAIAPDQDINWEFRHQYTEWKLGVFVMFILVPGGVCALLLALVLTMIARIQFADIPQDVMIVRPTKLLFLIPGALLAVVIAEAVADAYCRRIAAAAYREAPLAGAARLGLLGWKQRLFLWLCSLIAIVWFGTRTLNYYDAFEPRGLIEHFFGSSRQRIHSYDDLTTLCVGERSERRGRYGTLVIDEWAFALVFSDGFYWSTTESRIGERSARRMAQLVSSHSGRPLTQVALVRPCNHLARRAKRRCIDECQSARERSSRTLSP